MNILKAIEYLGEDIKQIHQMLEESPLPITIKQYPHLAHIYYVNFPTGDVFRLSRAPYVNKGVIVEFKHYHLDDLNHFLRDWIIKQTRGQRRNNP